MPFKFKVGDKVKIKKQTTYVYEPVVSKMVGMTGTIVAREYIGVERIYYYIVCLDKKWKKKFQKTVPFPYDNFMKDAFTSGISFRSMNLTKQ